MEDVYKKHGKDEKGNSLFKPLYEYVDKNNRFWGKQDQSKLQWAISPVAILSDTEGDTDNTPRHMWKTRSQWKLISYNKNDGKTGLKRRMNYMKWYVKPLAV